MIKKILSGILVIAIIGLGYLGWRHYYPSTQPAFSVPITKVVTTQAKQMNLPLIHSTIGTLIAPKSITITSQTSGKIVAVLVKNGQRIKRGDLLFRLDDTKERADLAASKASLASSYDTYMRMQELYQQSGNAAISKNALNQAKIEYLGKKAAVIQNQKAVSDTLIKASTDGTITALAENINVGSVISSSTVLVNLVTKGNLQINYQLGSEYSRLAQVGQKVVVYPLNDPELTFVTTVSYIAPNIDQTSRTFMVSANLNDPHHKLKPGLLMHVVQTLKAQNNVIAIPSIALVADISGYSVFSIKDGKAVKISVTIGSREGQYVTIKKGLTNGQTVIISRLNELKDGTPVQAVSAP